MEACSAQDQRPQRRRHDCRDDLEDYAQLGVVVVLGGDEHANHPRMRAKPDGALDHIALTATLDFAQMAALPQT